MENRNGPENSAYSRAQHNLRLRSIAPLRLIMTGKQAKILSDQQTRSLLLFPSSTRSIQTTQRHIDGSPDGRHPESRRRPPGCRSRRVTGRFARGAGCKRRLDAMPAPDRPAHGNAGASWRQRRRATGESRNTVDLGFRYLPHKSSQARLIAAPFLRHDTSRGEGSLIIAIVGIALQQAALRC
jgi:hypothetical protein